MVDWILLNDDKASKRIIPRESEVSAYPLTFVLMGGGAESVHTIFFCENNRRSNKIMHCVDFF